MSGMGNKKRKIAYIFCYARSGGTLLNRFLSNIDDLVILSEAHNVNFNRPNAGMMSIRNQVKKWYGIEVKSNNYLDAIDEISDWCEENGKTLVLRDWSYIDFTPSNFNNYGPVNFSLNYELLKHRFDVVPMLFVRDAIDVYLSAGHSLPEFSKSYSNFINYVQSQNVPVIRYEDFCDDYQQAYHKMAEYLGLPQTLSEKDGLFTSERVVGDINYSRGNSFDGIKILKRRYVPSGDATEIENDPGIKKVNPLFGYSTQFHSREVESANEHYKFKLKSLRKKVLKKLSRWLGKK